jgi:hypothetical protein
MWPIVVHCCCTYQLRGGSHLGVVPHSGNILPLATSHVAAELGTMAMVLGTMTMVLRARMVVFGTTVTVQRADKGVSRFTCLHLVSTPCTKLKSETLAIIP